MDSEGLAEALREAEGWLARLEKGGRSPKTIRGYRGAVTQALRWLWANGMHCRPEEIREDEIVALAGRYPATETTVHHYVKILGMFLARTGNPIVREMGLLWNEPEHPNARWITAEEFARILEACSDPTDRIIVVLAGYAGMRRSEIAGLKLSDILSDRMVVTGKGHGRGKQRIIPVTARIRAELDCYMEHRRRFVEDRDVPGLVVAFSPGSPPKGIASATVGKRVQRICGRAGVDASPHSFRRYFATRIWETMPDKDIKVLQTLLGHSSPTVTSRYIRSDETAMAEAMSRL